MSERRRVWADSPPCSCRFCQTLTTATGIETRGHGPDSETCARMLRYVEQEEAGQRVAHRTAGATEQVSLFEIGAAS
ncbi:hypothetical protein [Nocardioides speluncae]|uniref:hypothetical protein n=1 Tax=Nocardioides speluncae TaxID=2670337 RepID=UPI000D696493|nr:hypothetical protein [Nocardioides speluncae]